MNPAHACQVCNAAVAVYHIHGARRCDACLTPEEREALNRDRREIASAPEVDHG